MGGSGGLAIDIAQEETVEAVKKAVIRGVFGDLAFATPIAGAVWAVKEDLGRAHSGIVCLMTGTRIKRPG